MPRPACAPATEGISSPLRPTAPCSGAQGRQRSLDPGTVGLVLGRQPERPERRAPRPPQSPAGRWRSRRARRRARGSRSPRSTAGRSPASRRARPRSAARASPAASAPSRRGTRRGGWSLSPTGPRDRSGAAPPPHRAFRGRAQSLGVVGPLMARHSVSHDLRQQPRRRFGIGQPQGDGGLLRRCPGCLGLRSRRSARQQLLAWPRRTRLESAGTIDLRSAVSSPGRIRASGGERCGGDGPGRSLSASSPCRRASAARSSAESLFGPPLPIRRR